VFPFLIRNILRVIGIIPIGKIFCPCWELYISIEPVVTPGDGVGVVAFEPKVHSDPVEEMTGEVLWFSTVFEDHVVEDRELDTFSCPRYLFYLPGFHFLLDLFLTDGVTDDNLGIFHDPVPDLLIEDLKEFIESFDRELPGGIDFGGHLMSPKFI
jgi:hypothetical protein